MASLARTATLTTHGIQGRMRRALAPGVLDFLGSTSGRDQQGYTPSTPGRRSKTCPRY